ncbi:MAG: aminoacyl-tRNA hydrolase [Methylotenera sp.]|nr:aminoacyl-tRNA hydrolase [Oligoflexia bacterium]
MLFIPPSIQIPLSELELSYARSSGPGGQNVNKVNSKAVLRWNVLASPSLPLGVRARLIERLGSQLNSDGELVMTSDRFRDQIRNREDCFDKLRELIAAAAVIPKQRRETKPSYSSKRRVKESKSRNSDKKSMRKAPRHD